MDGPRACREPEFDEVISLINRDFRAGTDQDIRTDYPLIFDTSKLQYMRILKVDGKVVSHVPVAPREAVAANDRFMIGIISPTVTHPDYRARGYATLCLRDCIRIMEEEGWPVSLLWTQEATFPFYQKSGWEAVGPQDRVYRLGPQEQGHFEARSYDIISYDAGNPRHLESIMKMHDAEPYRISRSRTEYRALFALPKTSTFLAMQRNEVASYLMIGLGVNKPGLLEGGGDVEGLEALVRHALLERGSEEEVQVLVPLTPSGLGRLMEVKKPRTRRPIEEAEGVGNQMMRVNSLGDLLRQIGNHLRRKAAGLHGDVCLVCEETGEATTLKFRDGNVEVSSERLPEQLTLNRRQLAQLIFGPHPSASPLKFKGTAGKILQGIFPFYFPVWELDHS